MYIYSDVYKQFSCVGSDCKSTCCAGWKIIFDSDTVDYYNHLQGEFGELVRQSMYWGEKEGVTLVKMSDSSKCPLLNSKGLCRVFIECGENHMSETCRLFPRVKYDSGANSMRGFTVSCYEVLRMLYDKPDPLHLCAEGYTETKTMDDLRFYELAQFIGWGMEVLQDETVPFGVGLATVVYIAIEAQMYFQANDFESFEDCILQSSDIQAQFMEVWESMDSAVRTAAWHFIFGVTDAYCQIVREAGVFNWHKFLWPSHIFNKNDGERRDYLIECWKNREYSHEDQLFLRKLVAAFFSTHSMKLGMESGDSIYLMDLCNYFILALVVPPTWTDWPCVGTYEYLSRLSYIARWFEQSNSVKKFVWPVIRDLFHPDFFSYVTAFMVLLEG